MIYIVHSAQTYQPQCDARNSPTRHAYTKLIGLKTCSYSILFDTLFI